MEDETRIDLLPTVNTILRRWRIVVTLTVLVTVAAGLFSWTSPPSYQAVAGVAIIRAGVDVTFDERFKTLDNEAIVGVAADARRNALVGLVKNGAIAQTVIARLGEQLAPEEQNPADLMDKVEAQLVNKGDLIQITVTNGNPDRAAAIANAWAAEYERYINSIYGGQSLEYSKAISPEIQLARQDYDRTQADLEAFTKIDRTEELSRTIAEKQNIIDALQTGKQIAVTAAITTELQARNNLMVAYVDAVSQNRLLAFAKEKQAKRAMLSDMIDAMNSARLIAFQKDQEARTRLFTQYADTQIINRMEAITKEQEAKTQIFAAYANSDTRAKVAVFTEQVNARIQQLASTYDRKLKWERLLADARSLEAQIRQAGAAGSATNSLAILLLKAQAYASSASLPGTLQLQLPTVSGLDVGATGQSADLQAVISTLETYIADLDKSITTQSQALFDNQGYVLLDAQRPSDDPLFAAVKQKYAELFEVGDLAQTADAVSEDGSLGKAILKKYDELFGMGALAQASTVISPTSALFSAIKTQYPELFSIGDLSSLSEGLAADSSLAAASAQRVQELLQLTGMESLPGYATASQPLQKAIDSLQSDVRGMQSELEREQSTMRKLVLARDLAWQSYTALASKETELGIASAMGGSEVRFAAPAVTGSPVGSRVRTVAIAVVVGLLLGLASALAVDSVMSLYGAADGGGPGARRNRVFGWLLAESAGLPIADQRQKTNSRL